MTQSELKQLIKECLCEIDFNSDINKNPSKVDNFLNRLDDDEKISVVVIRLHK